MQSDLMGMRVYLAKEALNAYCNARGTINAPDEDITDLIVDMLHLLDTYEGQASARLVLDMVKTHYAAETSDDDPDGNDPWQDEADYRYDEQRERETDQ